MGYISFSSVISYWTDPPIIDKQIQLIFQYIKETIQLTLALFLLVASALAKDCKLPSSLEGCDKLSCPDKCLGNRWTVGDNIVIGIRLSHPDVPSSFEEPLHCCGYHIGWIV